MPGPTRPERSGRHARQGRQHPPVRQHERAGAPGGGGGSNASASNSVAASMPLGIAPGQYRRVRPAATPAGPRSNAATGSAANWNALRPVPDQNCRPQTEAPAPDRRAEITGGRARARQIEQTFGRRHTHTRARHAAGPGAPPDRHLPAPTFTSSAWLELLRSNTASKAGRHWPSCSLGPRARPPGGGRSRLTRTPGRVSSLMADS